MERLCGGPCPQHAGARQKPRRCADLVLRAKWEAEVYGEQDKKNEEYWNSHIEAENTLKRAEGEYSQNKKVWDKAKKKAVKEAMNQLKRIVVKCKPEKMNADLAHQLDELRINLENVLNN